MPRKAPERAPDQQKEHERCEALLTLDVPAMRVWLDTHGSGAFGDDALVLRAMHEARAVDPKMPQKVQRESIAWLREHYPDSATPKTIAAYPGGVSRADREEELVCA